MFFSISLTDLIKTYIKLHMEGKESYTSNAS